MFAVMWGTLGLVWTRLVMPLIDRVAGKIDWEGSAVRVLSIASAIFMVLNVALTIQAFAREGARADDLPPATPIDHFLDEQFPSTWMQERFENMSIYGSNLR